MQTRYAHGTHVQNLAFQQNSYQPLPTLETRNIIIQNKTIHCCTFFTSRARSLPFNIVHKNGRPRDRSDGRVLTIVAPELERANQLFYNKKRKKSSSRYPVRLTYGKYQAGDRYTYAQTPGHDDSQALDGFELAESLCLCLSLFLHVTPSKPPHACPMIDLAGGAARSALASVTGSRNLHRK